MTRKTAKEGSPLDAVTRHIPPEMAFEELSTVEEASIEAVTQAESLGGKIMNISARNVFEGTIKEIKEGATTAHVLIEVKGLTLTAAITNESVEDLRLEVGKKVKAVIKSSDVMVATD